jgi:NAD(P)-dependent dehydrogenase (short-subunit alcohol dehydrogenase family)
MRGKTVVITGATSGIGEVAAIRLAEKGARILFVAREAARAAATLKKLRHAGPGAAHAFHLADLSCLAEMKRIGTLLAAEPRIDVLVNNAGAIFNRRRETADGLEMTFALNHMAYFVVTAVLLGKLGRGARIISTASGAHRRGALNFDDLQLRHGYGGWRAYCRSKLCNILFTRELARRLAGGGVTANAFHPGFVATRFGDGSGGLIGGFVGAAKAVGAISPEEGAKTLVHLAASPQVAGISGEYFYQCRPQLPAKAARDDAAARHLWEVSERIAAL